MAIKTVTLLDPTVKSKTKELKMANRPADLAGKTVGLLWNSKPNGEVILERLAQKLNERYHFSLVKKQDKPQASQPAAEEVFDELGNCDFVIIAMAD